MQLWMILGMAVFFASISAVDAFRKAYATTRELGCFLIAFAEFVGAMSIFIGIPLALQMLISNENYMSTISVAATIFVGTLLVKMAARKMKKTEGLN